MKKIIFIGTIALSMFGYSLQLNAAEFEALEGEIAASAVGDLSRAAEGSLERGVGNALTEEASQELTKNFTKALESIQEDALKTLGKQLTKEELAIVAQQEMKSLVEEMSKSLESSGLGKLEVAPKVEITPEKLGTSLEKAGLPKADIEKITSALKVSPGAIDTMGAAVTENAEKAIKNIATDNTAALDGAKAAGKGEASSLDKVQNGIQKVDAKAAAMDQAITEFIEGPKVTQIKAQIKDNVATMKAAEESMTFELTPDKNLRCKPNSFDKIEGNVKDFVGAGNDVRTTKATMSNSGELTLTNAKGETVTVKVKDPHVKACIEADPAGFEFRVNEKGEVTAFSKEPVVAKEPATPGSKPEPKTKITEAYENSELPKTLKDHELEMKGLTKRNAELETQKLEAKSTLSKVTDAIGSGLTTVGEFAGEKIWTVVETLIQAILFGVPQILFQGMQQKAANKALCDTIKGVFTIADGFYVQIPPNLINEDDPKSSKFVYMAVPKQGGSFDDITLGAGSYYVILRDGYAWGTTYAQSSDYTGKWVNLNTGYTFIDDGKPSSNPYAFLADPLNGDCKGSVVKVSSSQTISTQEFGEGIGKTVASGTSVDSGTAATVASTLGIYGTKDTNIEIPKIFEKLLHSFIIKGAEAIVYPPFITYGSLNLFKNGIKIAGFLPNGKEITVKQMQGTGVFNHFLTSGKTDDFNVLSIPKEKLQALKVAQAKVQTIFDSLSGTTDYNETAIKASLDTASLEYETAHKQIETTIGTGFRPGLNPFMNLNAYNIYVYETQDTPIAQFMNNHKVSDDIPTADYVVFLDESDNIVPLFVSQSQVSDGKQAGTNQLGINFDFKNINPSITRMTSLVSGFSYLSSGNGKIYCLPGTSLPDLKPATKALETLATTISSILGGSSNGHSQHINSQLTNMAAFAINLAANGPYLKNGYILTKVKLDQASSGISYAPANAAVPLTYFQSLKSVSGINLKNIYVYRVEKGVADSASSTKIEGAFGSNAYDYVVPAKFKDANSYEIIPLGLKEAMGGDDDTRSICLVSLITGQVYDRDYKLLNPTAFTFGTLPIIQRNNDGKMYPAEPGQPFMAMEVDGKPYNIAIIPNQFLAVGYMPTFCNPYNVIQASVSDTPGQSTIVKSNYSNALKVQQAAYNVVANILIQFGPDVIANYQNIWNGVQTRYGQEGGQKAMDYLNDTRGAALFPNITRNAPLILPNNTKNISVFPQKNAVSRGTRVAMPAATDTSPENSGSTSAAKPAATDTSPENSNPISAPTKEELAAQLYTAMVDWVRKIYVQDGLWKTEATATLSASTMKLTSSPITGFAGGTGGVSTDVIPKADSQKLHMVPMYWMQTPNFTYNPTDITIGGVFLGSLSIDPGDKSLGGALAQVLPSGLISDIISSYNGWVNYMDANSDVAQTLQSAPLNFANSIYPIYLSVSHQNVALGNFFYKMSPSLKSLYIDTDTTMFVLGSLSNSIPVKQPTSLEASSLKMSDITNIGKSYFDMSSVTCSGGSCSGGLVAIDITTGIVWAPNNSPTYPTGGTSQEKYLCNMMPLGKIDPLEVLNEALHNQKVAPSTIAPQTLLNGLGSKNPGLYSQIINCQSVTKAKLEASLFPFTFAGKFLKLSKYQIANKNYVYAVVNSGNDDYYRASDYWVTCKVDDKGNPVLGQTVGVLTPDVKYMVSVVDGTVYDVNGVTSKSLVSVKNPPSIFLGFYSNLLNNDPFDQTAYLLSKQVSSLNATAQTNFEAKNKKDSVSPDLPDGVLKNLNDLSAPTNNKPVTPLYDNLYKVGSKYYIKVVALTSIPSASQKGSQTPSPDNSIVYYYDFNAQNNTGIYYLVDKNLKGFYATPVTKLTGYAYQAMLVKFGITIDDKGNQTLGLPVFNPPLLMADNDKALVPGKSGEHMRFLFTDLAAAGSQDFSNYYYLNNGTMSYLARRVLSQTIKAYDSLNKKALPDITKKYDYYVDLGSGEQYDVNGYPYLTDVTVAYKAPSDTLVTTSALDFSNPLFIWGELDDLGESMETQMLYQDMSPTSAAYGYSTYSLNPNSTEFVLYNPTGKKTIVLGYGTAADANGNLLVTKKDGLQGNPQPLNPTQINIGAVLNQQFAAEYYLVVKSYSLTSSLSGAVIKVQETFTTPKQYTVFKDGVAVATFQGVSVGTTAADGIKDDSLHNLKADMINKMIKSTPFCATIIGSRSSSTGPITDTANKSGSMPVICGLLSSGLSIGDVASPVGCSLLSLTWGGADSDKTGLPLYQYFGLGSGLGAEGSSNQYNSLISGNASQTIKSGTYRQDAAKGDAVFTSPYIKINAQGTNEYIYKYRYNIVSNAIFRKLLETVNVSSNNDGYMELVSALNFDSSGSPAVSNPQDNSPAAGIIGRQVGFYTPLHNITGSPSLGGRYLYQVLCSGSDDHNDICDLLTSSAQTVGKDDYYVDIFNGIVFQKKATPSMLYPVGFVASTDAMKAIRNNIGYAQRKVSVDAKGNVIVNNDKTLTFPNSGSTQK